MSSVISMLEQDPTITAISFPYHEFFGGFDYVVTGKWHLVEYPKVHRVFSWQKGYTYLSHRPATVIDEHEINLRTVNWISSPMNGKNPIFMYHYSYVFPKQARQKVGYYSHVSWTEAFRGNQRWLDESYFGLRHPFFLGEKGKPILQWLERFRGEHPRSVQQLRNDLANGKLKEPTRPSEDIEKLLSSPRYWLATRILRILMPAFWKIRRYFRKVLAGTNKI
jgi:hypothetical protein